MVHAHYYNIPTNAAMWWLYNENPNSIDMERCGCTDIYVCIILFVIAVFELLLFFIHNASISGPNDSRM